MFVVMCRWKIKTGDEDKFASAWSEVAKFLSRKSI